MKKNYAFSLLLATALTQIAHAELVGLDETSLESVDAQSGVGINFDALIKIDSITYSDDNGSSGGDLMLQDIRIGDQSDVSNVAAHTEHQIDIDGNEGLFITSRFVNTRVQVGGISVGNHIGSRSFGEFIYDFEGMNLLRISDAGLNGYLYNNRLDITDAAFQWKTNGQTFRIDGMTYNSDLIDMKLEEVDIGGGNVVVQLDIAGFQFESTIASMCFSSTACNSANSFGSFANNYSFVNSQIQIQGGGREGPGLNANMHLEFDTTLPGDGNFVTYTDEDTIKLSQITGTLDVTNFTFDIGLAEANLGDHIAMQWDQITGDFSIGNASIAGNSVGSFAVQFDYQDATHDRLYQNKLLLAPGVAFAAQDFTGATEFVDHASFAADLTSFYSKVGNTSEGISAFTEWNMTADFTYTEDTHSIMVDDYLTYGSGYVTLDLRADVDSIDASNAALGGSFLAIGVRDYKVNYSMAGLKVGDNTSQVQNGYEFLGFSPEASFTMDAAVEIRGGGAVDSGLTLDGDVLLRDANFAVTKSDSAGKNIGIYLDNASYEFHFRDVTLDVDSGGIKLVIGELWSEALIGDVRFGESTTGDSIGGLAIKQYQMGSELTINGGGSASQKCMSGTGVDATSCEANGGYWLDTGTEGLTLASKQILLQKNGNKENSISWETNRTSGQKDTGTAMILNNIFSSDGYDDTTNTYGVQSTTSVDVARSRVIKKEDGTDSNGITGNAGDEVITSGKGAAEYTYVTTPTDAQKANRPETLVISNNLQIKELNIDSVQMQHSNAVGTPSTMINSIKFQNLNLNSTLSVSPIR